MGRTRREVLALTAPVPTADAPEAAADHRAHLLRLRTAEGGYRHWHGYCTGVESLGSDRGLARYRLVMDAFDPLFEDGSGRPVEAVVVDPADITHGNFPEGPAGRFNQLNSMSYGLMSYSENQEAARALLSWGQEVLSARSAAGQEG